MFFFKHGCVFIIFCSVVTSFEGKFGYVRYFLKGDLLRSWPKAISIKKYITVIKPIDTNSLQYQRSVAATDESDFCCICCQSGSVSVTAQTDRVAYCPGESVAISARFSNNSIRAVRPYALLCQTQKFHAKGLTQTVTYRLCYLTGLQLQGRQSTTWDGQLLRLPPISPSILNCSLIEVHYCIKVGVIIPFCRDVRITLPIVVGTVPHRGTRMPVTQPTETRTRSSSLLPPSYNSLPVIQTQPYSDSETSCSDPPPAYIESILAGRYVVDDVSDRYDSDCDECEDSSEEITNVSGRQNSDAIPSTSFRSETDQNNRWWRRSSGEPGKFPACRLTTKGVVMEMVSLETDCLFRYVLMYRIRCHLHILK